jgi:hypothetical protein
MSLQTLNQLYKDSSDKHKGVFFYINRKKKQGKSSSHVMTQQEYARFQITLRRAHAIAASRSQKKSKK